MKDKKVAKSIILLIIMTFVSKGLGVLRDSLIAKQFGASYLNDSYIIALTVPNIFFDLIGVAIFTTFIPLLNQELYENGKEKMFEFANSIITILFASSCFICVLGVVNSNAIVKILAPGFKGQQLVLTNQLLKLSILNILFMSMTYGFLAILQTLGDFKLQAFFGIMLSLPIILYIIIFINPSIYGLMIGTVIGYLLQTLILIPSLTRRGYKYKFSIGFNSRRKKQMFKMITPIIIGSGITQISIVVEKMITSSLGEGYLFCLDLANKLNLIALTIVGLPVLNVVYSKIAYHINDSKPDEFNYYYSKTVIIQVLTLLPSTVLLIIYRIDIIKILFNHGNFNINSVIVTAKLLLWLSIGLIFMAYRELCCKMFYSLKNTKIPMINSSVGLIVLIIMNFILSKKVGIVGIAMASTISIILTTITIHLKLNMQFKGERQLRFEIRKIFMIIGANIVSFIILSIFNLKLTFNNSLITVILGSFVYFIVYIITLLLLKVNEVTTIINIIITKLLKKDKLTISQPYNN